MKVHKVRTLILLLNFKAEIVDIKLCGSFEAHKIQFLINPY